MTFSEYQKACLRTASMGLGPEIEMCVRALGLCGETEELGRTVFVELGSDEAVIKEGGDVLWYAAALAHMFGLTDIGVEDLSREKGSPLDGRYCRLQYAEQAQAAACQLAELVKKHVGHKKPANVEKVKGLLFAIVYKTGQAMPAGVTLAQVAETNVAKLRARYPAGFDMAIASAKADSSEAPVVDIRPRNIDADGRQVEEAEALAEVETVGHYPAGGVGEWKPGPV